MPLDGVLVVDKPAGLTSHDVVDVVRKAAHQRKVGHTGTLDPDATGVLVLCLGRATRLVRFLQAGRKTYVATAQLGAVTASQDASGEVTAETDASHVDEDDVREALERFRGEIEQVPPMVSALKVDGERLHEKARRGEVVEREPRPVTIHELVLEHFEGGGPRPELRFRVTCSAGTYVRTLAHDLGTALGVGGHLTDLRRVSNGPFTEGVATPLSEIEACADPDELEDQLVDLLTATSHLERVTIDDADLARRLTHGGQLAEQGIDGVYTVAFDGRLVGVYRDRDGAGRPEVVLLRPEQLEGTRS
ncbi:MAG: tRNA pseudouridine(55) synthase TruB [Nitriliruptorales bacterium]|nr:tRNA pseudouridine(55) synthase TruB [Nitriliruptorales bacterium]